MRWIILTLEAGACVGLVVNNMDLVYAKTFDCLYISVITHWIAYILVYDISSIFLDMEYHDVPGVTFLGLSLRQSFVFNLFSRLYLRYHVSDYVNTWFMITLLWYI